MRRSKKQEGDDPVRQSITFLPNDKGFNEFFELATGNEPFPYQRRMALAEPFPSLLNVPTGAGKTAAAVLGWLWRRRFASDEVQARTPRRLVYCLPMRVLVEQTFRDVYCWLSQLNLIERPGDGEPAPDGKDRIAVSLLMGGEAGAEWDLYPERDAILIGTQDMLLSRALNRGYAMSRYCWPIHFALLNNDCLWVLDEVQLMGAGLPTTVQLDAFRSHRWKPAIPCHTWWMSATVATDFLDTRDRQDWGLVTSKEKLKEHRLVIELESDDFDDLRLGKLLNAVKKVEWLTAPPVAKRIWTEHRVGTLTLMVCNTVSVAQALFEELRTLRNGAAKKVPGQGQVPEVVLLTSRFRRKDRSKHLDKLFEFEKRRKGAADADGVVPGTPGLIVVSTQVVEAGVDVSAALLWSELAPWASVIQRLGRLNRDGLGKGAIARFWMPKADKHEENKPETPNAGRIGPYDKDDLDSSRVVLEQLAERTRTQSEQPLRKVLFDLTVEANKLIKSDFCSVIRPVDLHGLFSTEQDLAGGFTDVSRFVRDADHNPDCQVYWRDWPDAVNRKPPSDLCAPAADELCPVPFYALERFLDKRVAYEWNADQGEFDPRRKTDVRPGMMLLLSKSMGGYGEDLGWTGKSEDQPELWPDAACAPQDSHPKEPDSEKYWLLLEKHLSDCGDEAAALLAQISLPITEADAVKKAAWWHDAGKAHLRWQKPLKEKAPEQDKLWAKFKEVKNFRPGLRHEAASALAAWHFWRRGEAGLTALAVYLIASHHGKVRTVLRGIREDGGDDVFGIRDGEATLPPVEPLFPASINLDLSVKTNGLGGFWTETGDFLAQSSGWSGMVAELLAPVRPDDPFPIDVVPYGEPRNLGPFRLAYLETLVIVADRRSSRLHRGGQDD